MIYGDVIDKYIYNKEKRGLGILIDMCHKLDVSDYSIYTHYTGSIDYSSFGRVLICQVLQKVILCVGKDVFSPSYKTI